MNETFQRVAALCGLRLSYYVTSALLATVFFLLAFTTYRTASPLYILLLYAVLPALMKAMFFSKKTKRENDLAFPLFRKKYRYTTETYQSMNLAYLLNLLLFAAWHISYMPYPEYPVLIRLLPSALAAASLFTRFTGTIGYRIYFHWFPLKAMH
ncbi:MAG: hypothetical protein J6K04_11765 [Lachnospiraceae bacterium]|nr:hypothetical protein [Lachnospiraceae bacterium]